MPWHTLYGTLLMYMYDLAVLTDSFEGFMDGAEPRRVSLFCGSRLTYNGSRISPLCVRSRVV
jgi:hypothetical protein